MPNGLEAPCFAQIADALLEQLRYEAATEAITEPFMRELPVLAPGLLNTHKRLQRRLVLMAEAERLFRLLIPFEMAIRSLAEIA